METLSPWGLATILVGGVATLAIFSFLIRENGFFRFFEHLFIGIAAGLAPMLTLRDFLWPQVLEPMMGGTITHYPDGTQSGPYQSLYLLYLIPMVFGLLYYTLYSRRYAWLAKVVIGFSLGASGVLAIRGFFAEVVPQIAGSAKPLLVFSSGGIQWGQSLNNLLFVVILLVVLHYFFFTIGRDQKAHARSALVGRPLLMICFGAFFGSTVMARLALLVERVQFIVRDWFQALLTIAGVG